MINLSYRLAADWNEKAEGVDWATASETELRYGAFMGDQIFVIDGADFSAKWGWVPILDFATSLVKIIQGLHAHESELLFEFTESDAQIQFNRQADRVLVTSNYSTAKATTPLGELDKAAASYAERVLRDAINLHPTLNTNHSLAAWYPSVREQRKSPLRRD
jgi:hypothetical protein